MIKIKKTKPIYPSNLTLNYVIQNIGLGDTQMNTEIWEDDNYWYIKTEYIEEGEENEKIFTNNR